MTEERIKNLLQEADGGASLSESDAGAITAWVYRRAGRRRLVRVAVPVAAVALVLIGIGLQQLVVRQEAARAKQTAAIEMQVKQLTAQVDSALDLVAEVLENQRRQQRLEALEAKLAAIPDPLEEIQRQADKTAFVMVYQAEKMDKQLNLRDSAVRTYKQVIRLFPETQSAKVARERLAEMKDKNGNGTHLKGDLI